MALLSHCWLLIEAFIIPHGFFSKWFYLSFYIHPFFLFFCSLFILLKKLLLLLYFPVSLVVRWIVSFVTSLIPAPSIEPEESFLDATEEHVEVPRASQVVEVVSGIEKQGSLDWIRESDRDSFVPATTPDMWLNEYLCSDRYVDPYLFSYGLDKDESMLLRDDEQLDCSSEYSFDHILLVDPHLLTNDLDSDESPMLLSGETQLDCSSEYSCNRQLLEGNDDTNDQLSLSNDAMVVCNSPVGALVENTISQKFGKGERSFDQRLAERFRFFNLLYQERLHGFRAISNDECCIVPDNTGLSMQQIRALRQGILRSLELDFELIYVAEISLHWEALHHQYRQVKIRTLSGDAQNRLFHHNVAGEFQKLQILLERFVEEEKLRPDYIPERLSFHYTIQVPNVNEFALEESNPQIAAEAIRSNMVSKAIEKCFEAYWSYIKTENKKSMWKCIGDVRRSHPQVEDPVELELLYDVTTTLRKKRIMMKDLQGKRRCWVRKRVEPLQTADDKIDLLLAMIDMKLVQRVLKMSLVSGSQLRWCHEKLNSLEFRQGSVFRSPTGQLFPCS